MAPTPIPSLEQAQEQLNALRHPRKTGIGLRWQVLLALTLVLALTLLLLSIVVLRINRTTLETQKQDDILKQSTLLAGASRVLLETRQKNARAELTQLAALVVKQKDMHQVVILQGRGLRVVAAVPGMVSREVGPNAEAVAVFHDKQARSFLRDTPNQGRELVVLQPIMASSGDALGVLSMRASMRDVDAQVARSERLLLFYLILQGFLQLLVGYILITRLVVYPVRAFAQATHKVADGDYEGLVQIRASNELGSLADDFNQMVRKLRANRQKLIEQVKRLGQANAEIEQAQHNLIRSEKLATVGTLAAGVAHEVGNPLAAVLGYMEMLQEDWLSPEERQDLLRRSHHELQRMDLIIRDLLDYARTRQVEHQALDLREVLKHSIHLIKSQPRLKRVIITQNLPASLPLVHVDEGRLQQVLVNLLLNAADAMDGQGEITLRILPEQEDGMLCLEIEDTGPGIPEHLQNKIFEPFFTTKGPGKGTGLGLAICHAIIDSLNGQMSVRSPKGQGAIFTLKLPAVSPKGS